MAGAGEEGYNNGGTREVDMQHVERPDFQLFMLSMGSTVGLQYTLHYTVHHSNTSPTKRTIQKTFVLQLVSAFCAQDKVAFGFS